MKKSILLFFLTFIFVVPNFAQPDWENPYVTGINKEPGHASMGLYSSVEKAEKDSRLRLRRGLSKTPSLLGFLPDGKAGSPND